MTSKAPEIVFRMSSRRGISAVFPSNRGVNRQSSRASGAGVDSRRNTRRYVTQSCQCQASIAGLTANRIHLRGVSIPGIACQKAPVSELYLSMLFQTRANTTASRPQPPYSPPPPPPPPTSDPHESAYDTTGEPRLKFSQRFGAPISALLLYSSLTMISLQYLWVRLTFEETRLKEEARIEGLQRELEEWKRKAEEKKGDSGIGVIGTLTGKSTWWKFW
ncbi:uncharacterized protein EV422DRAFT_163111 [Fimicolochytrium jonesii]|uniref:uncharacterized protein n=1 Tax=Fimicolochytrium jonesii TaxID=1396493 RepID=UPI0022FDB9E7|nr:uncharacterized protein EV422DRAFT_163111 [Fimicolochytrium jonesii]KAI8818731.1 hypothetical protein EV422DRAFT_163111 [Fimicolochytrium jonesii]